MLFKRFKNSYYFLLVMISSFFGNRIANLLSGINVDLVILGFPYYITMHSCKPREETQFVWNKEFHSLVEGLSAVVCFVPVAKD